MITINPVKFNANKSYISFGDRNTMTSSMAILALQTPDARREFEGNLNNAMPSNPITNVINKIARTYKYVVSSSEAKKDVQTPEKHISFLG